MNEALELHAYRRLLDMRSGEGPLVALAATTVCLVIALNVITIGTATALVLAEHAPTVLPPLYSAGAAVSICMSLGLASAVGRFARRVETAGGLCVFAAVLTIGWAVLATETRWTVLVLHPFGVVTSSLFVVQGYVLVNDSFDSNQARRLFPLVGAGGSIGAILAGSGLFRLAKVVGVRNLLLVAAALAVVAALSAVLLTRLRLQRRATPAATRLGESSAGRQPQQVLACLQFMLGNRLLACLAVIAFSGGVASTVFRFAFEVELQQNFEPAKIAAYIGVFNVATNLGALLEQSLIERWLIRKKGFVIGLVSLPLLLGLGVAVTAVVGGLWTIAVVRWAESVARYSLARTADELVVVPFSSVDKRRVRLLLVGLVAPSATLVASLLIAALGKRQPLVLLMVTFVLAMFGLAASLSTRKPYLEQLRLALSSRRIRIGGGVQRALLLDERTRQVIESGLAAESEQDAALALLFAVKTGLLLPRERVEAFYSHADEVVRRMALLLAAATGDARFVPALKTLLEREKCPGVAALAARALAEVDSRAAIENLMPWRNDPRPEVRLTVLGLVGGEAAVPTLVEALRQRDQTAAASEALRRRPFSSLLPALHKEQSAVVSAMVPFRPHFALVPALVPLLKTGNLAGAAAARILGHIDDARAVAVLTRALPGASGLQRQRVLSALARQRGRGIDFGAHRQVIHAEVQRELGMLLRCRILAVVGTEVDAHTQSILQTERHFLCLAAEASLCALLGLLYDPSELERVHSNLRGGDSRTRSLALDLLRQLLPAAQARLILPYLDGTPLVELADRAPRDLGWNIGAQLDFRAALVDAQEPWLRWLAMDLLGALPRTDSETQVMPLLHEIYALRQFPLFAELTPEQLMYVAEISEEVDVSAGSQIFQQGDPGDTFYLILRGEVTVNRGNEEVARLGERECFGESALLDGGLRNATVAAATDCSLSLISRHDFDDLLETHPSIARTMLAIMARRLATVAWGQSPLLGTSRE